MDGDIKIGRQFIKRLLANPAIKNLSPLQKEEQIIDFLKANVNQLYPTLSAPNFFPGKNMGQIFTILYNALVEETNEYLFPHLEKIVKQNINFSFISFLRQQNCPISDCEEQIINFIKRLLNKTEARRGFTGPLTAVKLNIIDKYINQGFLRREYVYFELTKVQKLKMSKEEINNMIKASLLIKTAINMLSVNGSQNLQELRAKVVQSQFVEKVFVPLREQLKLIPDELLKSALNSNISFMDNSQMEATSRIAAIFGTRCSNYRQFIKVDRGANTPDKSWFNIARKNYKFYGFDIKILDEFYKISAELGW